ncbi:MAG: hypothetical protein NC212_10485 [Staphylococcus sp.]|nr:hypothetical protein [Staphylococcus sp.]
MNKTLLLGMLLAAPSTILAQSAFDAYSLSQNDLRGSARFMSMGGAFTALGGDISTLNQNPGGIGVYRSSDITATLDISMNSTKFLGGQGASTVNHTKVACNNFGYIGTVNLGSNSVMPFFNWGASYSRVASFDRRYKGAYGNINTSLTNLVADFTTVDGIEPSTMHTTDYNQYNPYWDSRAQWLSTLMYTGAAINPVSANSSIYSGLYNYDKSSAFASTEMEEKGYIDEYSINFGGNISNMVYWGIGFGITDIEFKQFAYYSESIQNADVTAGFDGGTTTGSADYTLANYKHMWGSGFNFKAGVILKPINEFRIGLAVHTPTYYNLTYEGSGQLAYSYDSPSYTEPIQGDAYTDDGYLYTYDWKCRTPWRLMVGAAGVIGGRAIISADYEYRATNDIKLKDFDGNELANENADIKTYYKATNIMRLGAEYRVTPQFSIRAGYVYETSPVTTEAMDGYTRNGNAIDAVYMYTAGSDYSETQPSYTLDKQTQYITCGLGYRYHNFYADLAYVHRHRSSKLSAFSNYNENDTDLFVMAPSAKLTDNNNSIVLTVGLRF